MGLMVVPLLIFAFFGVLIGGSLILLVRMLNSQRQLAQEGGYSSLGDYLRAAPRSDKEKRDAADLALKGLVICLLGLIVPPLLAIGLFPFFFGARKVVYASMGLGLVDDADQAGSGRPAHGA